jgi:acetyl-CoA C-acetyltransferase
MPEAVIVSATRTPIGRARKGSFVDVRPDDLLAFAIRAALDQVPELDDAEVVDVMAGCALPENKQGQNMARRVALLAGLPESVPGTTVNRFCASSLQTIRMAYHAIKAGEGDAFVSCGVESVSQVTGAPTDPDAQRSQERAVAAQESGHFDKEITPYTKDDCTVVAKDDGPRPSSTLEALEALEPAFKPDGVVTAGNSCPLNDGAAAVVVMSDTRANELGLKPRARIVASAVTGIEPEIMGVGPIEAVKEALKRAGMTIDDVDVMELNEAFAAQVLPVCEAVGMDPFSDRFNPHGGAIALGHPFGMTGARIMTTLLNDLDAMDKTIGLETMCVGGGQGMAMVIERLN